MNFLKTWLKEIFIAQALILTGKRSLKRQKIKEITKETEKERQENQKTKLVKVNEKRKIIQEKENMKGQQATVDKNLPVVQARCAVFLILC